MRTYSPIEAALIRFADARSDLTMHIDEGGYVPDDPDLVVLINDVADRIERHCRRSNSMGGPDWISEHRLGAFEYLGRQ